MRNLLIGVVGAGFLTAGAGAWGWEVASYTPSAVVPQLPSAAQAVRLTQSPRAPLWWLRRPYQQATARAWMGVPARPAPPPIEQASQMAPQSAPQVAGLRSAGGAAQAQPDRAD
ncbi:hypothetical protein [uncultured Thiohalocapsa sp.]|uniref:hypothetical protein n=1 Tax=uncultured Thiohalocapsa sp. TaxID=768990 RepID=UPI0025D71C45|nr:hypothetical protein [uncultured Thiohalocapsa sp.]